MQYIPIFEVKLMADRWEDVPKSGLHALFVALFYIAASLLSFATVLVILNSLDDFLHAPIGIKDNPPEPGLLVQGAELAWFPLLLVMGLFAALRFASRHFRTVPMLLGTVIVVCGSLSLVGGILGEVTKQFFGGQEYFTKTVTPVLYVLFLMGWAGVGADQCIGKWRRGGKPRHGLAGLILVLAIMSGVLGLFVGNNDSGGLLMVVGLLLVGVSFVAYNANYLLGKPE
jgi:hypothetical protein